MEASIIGVAELLFLGILPLFSSHAVCEAPEPLLSEQWPVWHLHIV